MTGGKAAAGSSRAHRLDPHVPPERASIAPSGIGEAAFTIDRERGVVLRTVGSAQAATRAVPLASYAGVAVRIEPAGHGGAVRAFVQLLHTDPALTFSLVVSEDVERVAADWREWGRMLNLPLLVVAADGTVSAPERKLGRVTVAPAKARRYHSFFAARRPRFLARRKSGRPGPAERIEPREIIARD